MSKCQCDCPVAYDNQTICGCMVTDCVDCGACSCRCEEPTEYDYEHYDRLNHPAGHVCEKFEDMVASNETCTCCGFSIYCVTGVPYLREVPEGWICPRCYKSDVWKGTEINA